MSKLIGNHENATVHSAFHKHLGNRFKRLVGPFNDSSGMERHANGLCCDLGETAQCCVSMWAC